jgi:PAS domain S-box-containing protein
LERNVRDALAQRLVRWMLGPLWIVALGFGAIGFASVERPGLTRATPAVVALIGLLCATYLRRSERYFQAAAALSAMLFGVVASGVLINGVNAPVYSGGFVLLPLVIPLFGNRWGIATAGACVGCGVLWLALDHAGLALPAAQIPATSRVGLYVGAIALAFVIVGGMQRLLADALNDARRKTREVEAAHEAEAASEMAFHAVFDQASVGMVLLTASGAIAQLNQRAARWLGASEDALIGRALEAAPLWNEEQKTLIAGAVSAAAEGHNSKHELTVSAELGAQLVYQISASPFQTGASNLSHVIVEVVEVTDLVQTRAMLAQARRLEALGKLSGGVAHDLNNMLAAILGASELVRGARKSGDSQSMDSSLDMISTAVVRASSLTKQLLAFGRQDRFDSVDIDVNRLVLEMGRLFERTLHKNISVAVVPCTRLAYMRGDMAALENALLNLGLNAQDAMPNGGTLTVRVSVDARSGKDGEVVVIRVGDTGTGMSDAVRERLFDPFFTTKPVGKGTGLGLAAVHGTVLNHRGTIQVNTLEGIGTTFALSFPATAPPAVAIRPVEVRGPLTRLHAHVLLADDETLVRDALTAMLEAVGCEVQAVNDGEALIDALAAGAQPDVIVTDLVMPGLSGTGLVHALEATRPGCPLLLITGYTGEDVSSALSGRSSHRLLRKPFVRTDLIKALQELLPRQTTQVVERARTA